MLQSITKIITTILTLVTLAGIAFFGLNNGFKRFDRYMDLKAIQDCTSSYQQEITDETTGVVRNRPLEQQARECAIQKGVENWDGVWSDLLTE